MIKPTDVYNTIVCIYDSIQKESINDNTKQIKIKKNYSTTQISRKNFNNIESIPVFKNYTVKIDGGDYKVHEHYIIDISKDSYNNDVEGEELKELYFKLKPLSRNIKLNKLGI